MECPSSNQKQRRVEEEEIASKTLVSRAQLKKRQNNKGEKNNNRGRVYREEKVNGIPCLRKGIEKEDTNFTLLL